MRSTSAPEGEGFLSLGPAGRTAWPVPSGALLRGPSPGASSRASSSGAGARRPRPRLGGPAPGRRAGCDARWPRWAPTWWWRAPCRPSSSGRAGPGLPRRTSPPSCWAHWRTRPTRARVGRPRWRGAYPVPVPFGPCSPPWAASRPWPSSSCSGDWSNTRRRPAPRSRATIGRRRPVTDQRSRFGFASPAQLRQEASVTAARRRAPQTRPSLAGRGLRLSPNDVGYPLGYAVPGGMALWPSWEASLASGGAARGGQDLPRPGALSCVSTQARP